MEKISDKNWQNYWDDLMEQSDKPVSWGTIVNEKPLHGDKTVTEESKIHKTKKRKFKVKYK